jgi:hypothetical protein
VRSGNDGRPGVVPWGASMSLHSVSRVLIIYLCSRSRAPVSEAYFISLYELGTCESRFTVTAPKQSALNASHSDRPNATLTTALGVVQANVGQKLLKSNIFTSFFYIIQSVLFFT